MRPIQDNSDILHSWVEYYDTKKSKWVPIDPTWQDTSHIDYFSSLDFNHIVFAIHGKKADYPYPAGSYKFDATSKDVYVKPINRGNVAIWNKKVNTIMQGASVESNSIVIDYLLPGESKNYSITFKPNGSLFYQSTTVEVQCEDEIIGKQTVTVPTFIASAQKWGLPIVLLLFGGSILAIFISRKHSPYD